MAAARTPASIAQENMGSSKLVVANFTSVVTGDTWVSGISGIKKFWAQAQGTGGTQASAGINVSLSGSTFTMVPGFDTQTVDLFVMING